MKTRNQSVSPLRNAALVCAIAAVGLSAGTANAAPAPRYIVAFKAGAADHANAAVIRERGNVKRKISGMNAMAVELSDAGVAALRADPNIDYVEEDVPRYIPEMETPADAAGEDGGSDIGTASSPASGKNYYLGQHVPYGIGMVEAHLLPNGASLAGNRKICIIDSGYDRAHEDLNNNGNVTGEYDSGTGWWNTDENSHGTHVAGTIMAQNNNGVGVVGVLPARQLRLHIVKVFGANGWAYSSELADAANKCGAAGAHIINMSLSGPRPSVTEQAAFDALAAKGVLSFAASSNAGTTAPRWPAGYDSVVSVGALDKNKQWASFSNYNAKVELSGPGVSVVSTVPMNTATASELKVGAVTYSPGPMTYSPRATRTAPLADFGLGTAVNPAMAGKVCLIERGAISFGAKVANCEASGGVAAVVYNIVSPTSTGGSFSGTLGGPGSTIPTVTASAAEGAAMKGQLGELATVTVRGDHYAAFNGTSMATPHVAAVAGLVWSYFPMCSAADIRSALASTAEDLGAPGRDHKYGYGLVRAKAAYDYLATYGCGN